jgi:hypothetical protein
MQMKRPVVIFGVAAAMIAITCGFLAYLQAHQKLSKPGVKLVPVPAYGVHGQLVGSNSVYLPEVANFTSTPRPIDDSVLEWLPKDTTYGQRAYQAADGFEAAVSVVLMGTDRTSIHRPELCLPAQGWVIDKEEQRTIPMKQPYPYLLPVKVITSHSERALPDGRKIKASSLFVYWFVSENQVMSVHFDYQLSILTHLLSKGELQRWAYVSCFAVCAEGGEEQTFQRIKELVTVAVPQFQTAAGPREAVKTAGLLKTTEVAE